MTSQGLCIREEAARLLGVWERTFRRYVDRYEDEGLPGLIDKRLNQASHPRAPEDEVMGLVDQYRHRHEGWSTAGPLPPPTLHGSTTPHHQRGIGHAPAERFGSLARIDHPSDGRVTTIVEVANQGAE